MAPGGAPPGPPPLLPRGGLIILAHGSDLNLWPELPSLRHHLGGRANAYWWPNVSIFETSGMHACLMSWSSCAGSTDMLCAASLTSKPPPDFSAILRASSTCRSMKLGARSDSSACCAALKAAAAARPRCCGVPCPDGPACSCSLAATSPLPLLRPPTSMARPEMDKPSLFRKPPRVASFRLICSRLGRSDRRSCSRSASLLRVSISCGFSGSG
mmetsp:Transcript_19976/g.59343  ORF Transcript_19976/g.59343 Transcript_19976/m.59343 type:complete len:214 (+) Transcript_19976:349-990(+)